jgi:hypothetical protein
MSTENEFDLPETQPAEPAAETAPASPAPGETPVDTTQAGTAEELGGKINEGGGFEPDFDSIIDDITKDGKIPRDDTGKFLPRSNVEVKKEPSEEDDKATETEPVKAEPLTAEAKPEPAPAPSPTAERDADLKELESKLDPHASPKTRNHFKAQAEKIVEARNRADAQAAEAAKLKAELDEARKGGLPPDVKSELDQLRDTVRSMDAAADPALKAKYDKPIEANNEAIIKILKANSFGLDSEGKEIPGVVDALKKAGITRKNLEDKIQLLEKAGELDAAEEIRDLLRENNRLAKEKDREVVEIKGSYEQRAKAAQENNARELETAQKRLSEEFTTHKNKFAFLEVPPAVKPEDSPAVKKEKEKAISAFNESVNNYAATVKKETATPTDAQISARIGILYRDLVVPHFQRENTSLKTQLDAANARIKSMQGAGNLNKPGAAAPRAPAKPEIDPSADFDDAIDQMARAAGISTK